MTDSRLLGRLIATLIVGALAPPAHATDRRSDGPADADTTTVAAAMVPVTLPPQDAAGVAGAPLPGGSIPLTAIPSPPARGDATTGGGDLLLQSGGGAPRIRYYGLDALGSVRVVFDAAGNVVSRTDYEPFGAVVSASTTGALPRQQFTGQERDGEVGVDYLGARMYWPQHGRMPSVDPIFAGAVENPQRWNRYAYALNMPINLVDPDGRTARTCAGKSNGKVDDCRTGGGSSGPEPTLSIGHSEHSVDLFLLMQYGDYGYGAGGGSGINMAEWDPATQTPRKPVQNTAEQTAGAATTISSAAVAEASNPIAIALPALQVVSRVIASFPAARAAWAAATAALVARSAARLSMTPQGSRFLELAHEAALKYPGKVGRFEYHHIWPQFMGGPGNGPMILLPAPYHQMITTEFAQRAGGPLSPQAAQKIMIEVYTKYPIW